MVQTTMKVFTLANLQAYDPKLKTWVGEQISTSEQKSIKTVAIDGNTLKFYKVEEPVGSTAPAYTIELPETDISGLITKMANATAGNVVIAKADGTVEDSGIKASDLATKTEVADAKKAGTAAQADIDALKAKVGEVPADKTVVQMISDVQTVTTYDDTQIKADIKKNTDAITLLNDASTVEGSVDYKIAQAVAKIMENPDETMNSINELVTWCNAHATEALALTNKVTASENAINALEDLVGETGVAQQITDAITAALKIDGVDKYALATDLTAAIGRIAALEAKSHEHANKTVLDGISAEKVSAWDGAEQNAKDYADGLAVNYATAAQGTKADSALQKVDIVTGTANGTIAVKGTDVAVKGLDSAAYAKTTDFDAAGVAETKVNALANGAVATNTSDIATLKGKVETLESVSYVEILEDEINALSW